MQPLLSPSAKPRLWVPWCLWAADAAFLCMMLTDLLLRQLCFKERRKKITIAIHFFLIKIMLKHYVQKKKKKYASCCSKKGRKVITVVNLNVNKCVLSPPSSWGLYEKWKKQTHDKGKGSVKQQRRPSQVKTGSKHNVTLDLRDAWWKRQEIIYLFIYLKKDEFQSLRYIPVWNLRQFHTAQKFSQKFTAHFLFKSIMSWVIFVTH